MMFDYFQAIIFVETIYLKVHKYGCRWVAAQMFIKTFIGDTEIKIYEG